MKYLNSFQEAYDSVKCESKPMLLLGNGFSLECCKVNNIVEDFSYKNLLNKVKSNQIDNSNIIIDEIFSIAQTKDFEYLMCALNRAIVNQKFVEIYHPDHKVSGDLQMLYDKIQDILINSIISIHPRTQYEKITLDSYSECAKFLEKFGDIFTISYDLFLYWAQMNSADLHDNLKDGFWLPDSDNENYWDSDIIDHLREGSKRVCYLHGGLHIYKKNIDDQIPFKVVSSQVDEVIVEQIEYQIKEGRMPLFVLEGDSSRKREKIYNNMYLTYCYNALLKCKAKSIFTYGVSFENDDHILDAINNNEHIEKIYVGTYEKDNIPINKTLNRLRLNYKKEIITYPSNSIKPWGGSLEK